MAFHKKHEFSEEEQHLARLAKALAHPARIAIIKILIQKSECICGDLVLQLPLAQSTVSQHLKELLDAGFIQGTIDGPRSCYCINPNTMEMFKHLFELEVESKNSNSTSCC